MYVVWQGYMTRGSMLLLGRFEFLGYKGDLSIHFRQFKVDFILKQGLLYSVICTTVGII